MYSHEYNIYITLAYNAHLKSQFGRSRNYGTADAVGALCVCVCVCVCVCSDDTWRPHLGQFHRSRSQQEKSTFRPKHFRLKVNVKLEKAVSEM